MIKLLALNRGAEEADRSFLPVNPPAVLLNTLLSLKTEIFVCGCTFFSLTAAPLRPLFCKALTPVKCSPQTLLCHITGTQGPLMLGHDPPWGAGAVVDGSAGDKHTLLPLHSAAVVSRPP